MMADSTVELSVEVISADDLIGQIADTLCGADVADLCEIANSILSATHVPAGEDENGYDLIKQEYRI